MDNTVHLPLSLSYVVEVGLLSSSLFLQDIEVDKLKRSNNTNPACKVLGRRERAFIVNGLNMLLKNTL
ncbi:hypothetical protein D3C78_1386730 [compost metagenome]